MAAKVDAQGKLLYGAGNICNHYFTVAFLRQVATAYQESPQVLPYHHAKKKVPYAGEDGVTVTPDTPNAVKLEAFIFDSFSLASASAILEVGRARHPLPAAVPAPAKSRRHSQHIAAPLLFPYPRLTARRSSAP